MNNTTAARLYLLFAFLLLVIGWKICHTAQDTWADADRMRASQLELGLGE